MAVMKEFKLPDLGEGVHEGQVMRLLVSEGELVNEDQHIMEVETDKAAVEIPLQSAARSTASMSRRNSLSMSAMSCSRSRLKEPPIMKNQLSPSPKCRHRRQFPPLLSEEPCPAAARRPLLPSEDWLAISA